MNKVVSECRHRIKPATYQTKHICLVDSRICSDNKCRILDEARKANGHR